MGITELSPFLGAEGFLGNRISLERYSLSRCTLACRDSVHLFRRLGSNEIPMVRATFLWMPATLSSSRLKPLPARTFMWYLTVGHLTTGRRGPDVGRGAMQRALACRALSLRILRAGWLNHVATRRCQSLWKWDFRIMPFRLGAMAVAGRPPPRAHGRES
uniref:Uncharacterized protein n=1 Tax=Ovis aries TaxID=9940 RepID=A0AC11D7Q6_SHEEP